MELALTLLIVALAVVVVARRCWMLFRTGGKTGCGSGCGSCPAGGAQEPAGENLVSLDLPPMRQR